VSIEIWIPESAREAEEPRKVRVCMTCGVRFPWEQKGPWQRHVIKCSDAHPEVIGEHQAELESSVFTRSSDPEARKWISKRLSEGKPATRRGNPA
jgi:hypothetical protein